MPLLGYLVQRGDFVAQGVKHSLRSRFEVKLGEDVVDVSAHGRQADHQPVCDLLIAQP